MFDKNQRRVILSAVVILAIGYFLMDNFSSQENMDERRLKFISEKESMVEEMLMDHGYRCCLEKPCTYCIEKTPGHGEGAACNCLEDVVTGKHPCGECIGEILEGHGNRFLAKYFATSIAEEVGEHHIETLRKIVSEKYEISIEEQL
jgi:hypothetical protein